MQCPACRTLNREGRRFCSACGALLPLACAACGFVNQPGDRFCGSCGTALGPPGSPGHLRAPDSYTPEHLAEKILTSKGALEGERKKVTVLFADLKGSLELLADRDPEEARKLLDPVIERMMEAVHRYEGTVNQVMGDGIMALFGAPLACEDHAVRACYAALSMQESVSRYAEEAFRAHRVPIQIRVGLNSGEVVVRSIGSDLHMDYTAVGQTTHLAARMEQAAMAGSILMTADTLRLVEGYVQVTAHGAVPVKGLAAPVEVYELTGVGNARTRLQAAARRGLTRFVGREPEMHILRRALDLAGHGHGQVVAVVGEPGVGKSRLIWELVHSSWLEGWLVLEAHAAPWGKGSPYLPIVELLRGYFQLDPGHDADAIRDRVVAVLGPGGAARLIAPTLALVGVPVEDDQWTRLDPAPKRRRILEAVKYVLTSSARARPACVVVEDLHWADPETIAVLDAVVDSAAASRLLVVVSYRPEHQHSWGGKTYYSQLTVGTLATRETEALLEELLGSDATLDPLKRLLAERTGGNPFFLEESVRNLVETGTLAGDPGRRRLGDRPEVAHVPDTVQAVLAARIDRLRPDDKRVLQTASAIGRDVPRRLLEEVADAAPDELAENLARLQTAELLYEVRLFPEVEYTFRHALTHEVAYGGLLRERRRALDERMVEALEARALEGDGPHVDQLAHHAVRGELWAKAIIYCRRAGQQALARFAHRAAAAHFEQALNALGYLPSGHEATELAIDIRLELRYALLPLGEYRRMGQLLTEARRLAESLGDRRRQGLIACLLCNYFTLRFEFPLAVEHGDQALGVAAALDDAALAQATNAMLALAHYGAGDYRRAADAGVQAATTGSDVQRDRFGLVLSPAVYGPTIASWALAELGRFTDARRLADRALATAEALRHPHSVIFACLGLGTVHLRQGSAPEAIGVLERALAIWETADLPAVLLELAGPLASAYAEAGRAADAIALLERAVAQALTLRHRIGNVLRSGGMAEAYLAAGRVDEALPLARLYVDLAKMVNGRGHVAWALRLLGEVAARLDPPDADLADTTLTESLALARELGMRPLEARVMLARGRLLQRVGEADQARQLIRTAAEQFAALGMPTWAAACRGDRPGADPPASTPR